MLERIAMHQTRLRTPGISLDAKGIAVGAKGLVLLPSLDRLVGFLALYTRRSSLGDLVRSLRIEVVRSELGGREVVMSFDAEGSEAMDRVAEIARLAGGHAFTGTKRHFVQYRDAAAPFGYDLAEISPTDAPLSLSHRSFTQDYQPERTIDLAALLLRLEPRLAPAAGSQPGPRWICTEAGLGPALIHYFVRSEVAAEVGVAEWPPASDFEDSPRRRYLFRLEAVPARMHRLLERTPGMAAFVPTGAGAAVEVGYEHPVDLRGCPVFPQQGLVLFRGGGPEPLVLERLPALGPVSAFARVELRGEGKPQASRAAGAVEALSVPLRLAPEARPWREVTATLVGREALGLLRRLAYRLGRKALEETRIAFAAPGAFLLRPRGIEAIPLGDFFCQLHERIFVSAGYAPLPAVSAEVLYRALGSPAGERVFLHRDGTRLGIADRFFVPLEQALLDAQSWSALGAEQVGAALTAPLPTVELGPVGLRPMRDVAAPEPGLGPKGRPGR